MKKRDIFLDFTALLDVTLIVIFFFVLFSHLENEENKMLVDEKVKEYETAIKEVNDREETANDLIKQLEQELEIIRNSDERQAEDAQAILEYRAGKNLKMVLDLEEGSFVVYVNKNKENIAKININSNLSTELLKAMENTGYMKEDTIFCDIVFDGLNKGSNKAYQIMMDALDDMQNKFPNMYYSITNVSIGKTE